MAFVYGVLGLVVILTAGTFGTINASPWFNLGIALLFVVLGLAMFDLITIDFSRFSSRLNIGGAPRLGHGRVRHGRGRRAAGRRVRRPGRDSGRAVLERPVRAGNDDRAGARRSCSASAWRFRGPLPARASRRCRNRARGWSASSRCSASSSSPPPRTTAYQAYSLFANRWVDPAAVESSVQEKLKAGWYSSIAAGLDAAKREQKPVLIDLWATWCKNCLVMDNTTLKDPGVTAALDGYVKIKYQAEDPDSEPAKSIMQRFEAVGLPAYVILRPKNPVEQPRGGRNPPRTSRIALWYSVRVQPMRSRCCETFVRRPRV